MKSRLSRCLTALGVVTGLFCLSGVSQARGELWADTGKFADEVFRLTNAERAAHHLPALHRENRLDRSAALFSLYMGKAGFFEHVGPDGVEPGTRMERQGYDWSWWGENIAWGYRTPQEVLESWMNSPGHRANILSPNFTDLGVGIAVINCKTYMTQDFGTQRPSLHKRTG